MEKIGRGLIGISAVQRRDSEVRTSGYSLTRLLTIALAAFVLSSCVAPYMTAKGCADFCHAEGKSVESYTAGAQIPIFKPRPTTRCICKPRGPMNGQ